VEIKAPEEGPPKSNSVKGKKVKQVVVSKSYPSPTPTPSVFKCRPRFSPQRQSHQPNPCPSSNQRNLPLAPPPEAKNPSCRS
jgi:hypothetical protein